MFDVLLHRKVEKFLKGLDGNARKRCKESIELLAENPFVHRPGCDLKKLSGQRSAYRLRVGDCRFVYGIDGKTILLMEAFRREHGYK